MTNYYKLTVPNDGTQTRFSIPASKAIFFKSATLADAETEAVKVILSKGANDVSGAFVALKGLIINDTDFDTITLSNDGSDTATVELFTSEGSFKFAGATSGGTATIPNPLEDTALKNPGAITQDNGNALEISATGANVDISGEQVTAGNNTLYASDAGMVKLMTSDEKTGIRMLGGVQAFTRIDGKYLMVPDTIKPAVSGGNISINDGSFSGAGSVDVWTTTFFITTKNENDTFGRFEFYSNGTEVEAPQFLHAATVASFTWEVYGGVASGVEIQQWTEEKDEENPSFQYQSPRIKFVCGKYDGAGNVYSRWCIGASSKRDKIYISYEDTDFYYFDPDTGTFKKETT